MSFHQKILNKYRIRRTIGEGAYGVVSSAKEIGTDRGVAIKLVGKNNFTEPFLAKRALRELKILKHLTGHENIALFLDCEVNSDTSNFTELYVIEGLMEADLNQILKSGQQLTSHHFQYFLYQLLRGLKWMHSANILHRDLKPGNLLVNSDCELRICDFGLARGETVAELQITNTEYVATRYYRAPEVVLSPKHYSKAIDIWSVGCIFGEMLTGEILFKGKNYIDQLSKIFDVLGTPRDPTLTRLCTSKVLSFLKSLPRRQKANFTTMFSKCDSVGLTLLDQLLEFDPSSRITATNALSHPYLATYHIPEDEPDCPKLFDFEFESTKTIGDINNLILKEVQQFQAEQKGKKTEISPRRASLFNGKPMEESFAQNVTAIKEEEEIIEVTSLEEELHMRELKI